MAGGFASAAATLYTIQDISGLADASADGVWLNDLDQIVAGNKLWNNGTVTTLNGLGGGATYVHGINDSGQIVGRSRDASGYMQAVVWNGLSPIALPKLGGEEGFATGIDSTGQIVGYTDNAHGSSVVNYRATFWPSTNAALDMGALPGNGASRAMAVNNLGQAAGVSYPAEGDSFNYGAFFWNGSAMTAIASNLSSADIEVADMNDSGRVVGTIQSTGFVWQAGATLRLGTLGGDFSRASGINNLGQIVGWSGTAGGDVRPFIYDNGQMIDLNTVVTNASDWDFLQLAFDINGSGEIVGTGKLKSGFSANEVFLLTPIPEPKPGLLLLLGAIGANWLSRKRITRQLPERPTLTSREGTSQS